MTASLVVVLLGVSATGFHDHGPRRAVCCEGCGGQPSALTAAIRTLRTSPKWRARDDAAEALGKFDWRRHPEAALALSDALLLDPKDDVREEAAESLKKMAPCVPMVHAALSQAAAGDPEDDVREEARDALKAVGRRCVVDCQVCGPHPTVQAIPPDWTPILAPDRGAFPAPSPVIETGPALEAIPPTTNPPSTVPDASPLPDTPPPPPTPYVPPGPVGARNRGRLR